MRPERSGEITVCFTSGVYLDIRCVRRCLHGFESRSLAQYNARHNRSFERVGLG